MTHPRPFSSTTTATGLPSTPSRNPSLQPQARRACVNPFSMWRSYYTARASGVSTATSECSLLFAPRQLRPSRRRRSVYDSQSRSHVRSATKSCDRSRSAVGATRRTPMKTMWEEDPTELLGLEEDVGSSELGGSEFEEDEDDQTELMGLGDQEGEDEDDMPGYEEEEDPMEMSGLDEDDEYEEEGEESPEAGQRIPGLRIAQGLRARRRARLLGV